MHKLHYKQCCASVQVFNCNVFPKFHSNVKMASECTSRFINHIKRLGLLRQDEQTGLDTHLKWLLCDDDARAVVESYMTDIDVNNVLTDNEFNYYERFIQYHDNVNIEPCEQVLMVNPDEMRLLEVEVEHLQSVLDDLQVTEEIALANQSLINDERRQSDDRAIQTKVANKLTAERLLNDLISVGDKKKSLIDCAHGFFEELDSIPFMELEKKLDESYAGSNEYQKQIKTYLTALMSTVNAPNANIYNANVTKKIVATLSDGLLKVIEKETILKAEIALERALIEHQNADSLDFNTSMPDLIMEDIAQLQGEINEAARRVTTQLVAVKFAGVVLKEQLHAQNVIENELDFAVKSLADFTHVQRIVSGVWKEFAKQRREKLDVYITCLSDLNASDQVVLGRIKQMEQMIKSHTEYLDSLNVNCNGSSTLDMTSFSAILELFERKMDANEWRVVEEYRKRLMGEFNDKQQLIVRNSIRLEHLNNLKNQLLSVGKFTHGNTSRPIIFDYSIMVKSKKIENELQVANEQLQCFVKNCSHVIANYKKDIKNKTWIWFLTEPKRLMKAIKAIKMHETSKIDNLSGEMNDG